ncbi:MAG: uroporphyrinogen-III C-methyltransferase [Bacillota bacterium]|nr:uroporphyrinogen-III C-methyltransferase [Bacillota bacterium]
MNGIVYIIGAGPGDERLITVKALECIKNADVVVYDRLINIHLLSYANISAEKIDVGKKANNHTMPQNEINELLAVKAKEGKRVVRLKGGDPFVFGRGGEEALHLLDQGIRFEIVPGVSAASAVPAYAGIPVTHRGVSSSFHVITGHEDPTKNEEVIDYNIIAKLTGTLVFFMGLNNLDNIRTRLIENGKAISTPVAVISNGTSNNQKTVVGTLGDIHNQIDKMQSPALIVVGDVIKLKPSLDWFENRPMFGKKVLITRAKQQSEELSSKLENIGAVPVLLPTIDIQPNLKDIAVEAAYDNIEQYDWIIFTSGNAVDIFMQGLIEKKGDIRAISKAKLCVVGGSTKKMLQNYYLKPEFMPSSFKSEALGEELLNRLKQGEKVLIPCSDLAENNLSLVIKQAKAEAEIVYIYKNVMPDISKDEAEEALRQVEFITFTSPSCVNNLIKVLQDEKKAVELLSQKKTVCIGDVTLKAAENLGIRNCYCAKTHSLDGMLKTILENV